MSCRSTRAIGSVMAWAAVGCAAAAAGCSASGPAATAPNASAGPPFATTAAPPPETRRPDESQGAFVFRTQCAGCHGSHGEGNLGPSLAGVGDRMTEADQLALVQTGRGR